MDIEEELENELQKVKDRIEILNMIEERLFKMKLLAEEVVHNELKKEEIEKISKEVKYLKEQIVLLEKDPAKIS